VLYFARSIHAHPLECGEFKFFQLVVVVCLFGFRAATVVIVKPNYVRRRTACYQMDPGAVPGSSTM